MHIDIIDSFDELEQLKGDWNAVYDADPEAQFFLSWTWMSKWLAGIGKGWFVLAARPSAEAASHVAFLPLRWRATAQNGGSPRRELAMAGNRAADYTGFLCRPEIQDQAIPAFARRVGTLEWTSFNLEFVHASDERLSLFLQNLRRDGLRMREIAERTNGDDVNHCVCPYVGLPESWDLYLSGLGSGTRQRIRRLLRRIELSDEFRITHADKETAAEHLDVMLELWASKWGDRKGETLESIERVVRVMCMHCAGQGALFLPILWRRDRPVGALASFVDARKKALLFYIGGRDGTCSNPPPGFVLHAYSIRHAISCGFSTYDFLRGNDPYKYAFGCSDRRIRHVVLSARSEHPFDVV